MEVGLDEQHYETPFVSSVLHPSDFRPGSENAFAHALAIALHRKTRFTILHAGKSAKETPWMRFPPVRATLERWGLLEKGSSRAAVFEELQLRVDKVKVAGRDPMKAALKYLEDRPTDLIVLATEGRGGLPRWIRPSVAEEFARRSETKTLFVPHSAPGFISYDDGSNSLRRILIPVDQRPNPHPPIVYASRAAAAMGNGQVEIVLLHVGPEMPELDLPESTSCRWRVERTEGDVIEQITRVAVDGAVDLIAMATEGHQGILDALRGSVTEQVLRRANCPVLAVPA